MYRTELDALERVAAIAVVLDPDGRIVDQTANLLALTGRTADQLRGRPLVELLADAADAAALGRTLTEVAADGRPRRVDAALIGSAGERRAIAWTCSRPGAHQVIAVGTELTATLEARDAAVADTLGTHSRVLMSMAEAVSFSDRDGVIRFTNRALDTMFGYGAGELVGQHVSVLNDGSPEDSARVVAEVIATLGAGHSWRGEFRNRRKDGSVFYTSAHISTVHLPEGPRWISVQEDITERRRTRLELMARERELSAIYANVPGIVFYVSVDPDGEFRFASINQAFLDVTGLRREQVVGTRVRDVIPPPSREVVLRHYQEAIRTGQTQRWEEVSVYPAGERYGEVAVTPLSDPGDGSTRLIGIVHDLTERRAAELALRDADTRKNEFLATLSHELRTPLASIRNALGMLELEPDGDRSARARAILDRQVTHLVHLVDDLLDVTRITRAKVELRRSALELGELLAQTVEDHQAGFEASGITLELTRPDEALHVFADATRLVQVIGNLLGNAMKFTLRGGRVEVSLARRDDTAELRVRDNGVGIERDVLAQLFVPFSQARQPLDRSDGGLGLGLALVKRLVELHDGTVALASDGPGEGTELTVRLPLGPAPIETEPLAEPAPGVRRRVLVIEDNDDAAESLLHLLEMCGHEVRLAHDGAAGLAAARALRPEVVFCDLGLPKMSGYEVARALRSDAATTGVALIALSGYAQPDDRARSAAAGFDDHVAKPPTRLELQQVMDTVTRARAARRESG